MKKYAFVDFGGQVIGIEDRCSCFYRKEALSGEIAVEDIIHPDLINRYIEIPAGQEVTAGMIYSDGKFQENLEYNHLLEMYNAVQRGATK